MANHYGMNIAVLRLYSLRKKCQYQSYMGIFALQKRLSNLGQYFPYLILLIPVAIFLEISFRDPGESTWANSQRHLK